jgi:hypothetical protein
MSRKIVVEGCATCPHSDHQGAFGRVAYIPTCKLKGGEVIPYITAESNGRLFAHLKNTTPEWCPLPYDILSATPAIVELAASVSYNNLTDEEFMRFARESPANLTHACIIRLEHAHRAYKNRLAGVLDSIQVAVQEHREPDEEF